MLGAPSSGRLVHCYAPWNALADEGFASRLVQGADDAEGEVIATSALRPTDDDIRAALAAFLLAPHWLLLAGLGQESAPNHAENAPQDTAQAPSKRYVQRALPFCMLAMLAAAWAPL